MNELIGQLDAHLGGRGIPPDAYCLVGEAGGDHPGIRLPEVGFWFIVTEAPGLDRAATAFLARHGARRSWPPPTRSGGRGGSSTRPLPRSESPVEA